MDIMISRRDFIVRVARHALAVGGAGMILSDPFWQRFLFGGDAAIAFGGSYLDELVRSAPRARYWVSPTSSGANCRSCHSNRNIKDKGHRHKETIVKCLLCAQSCVIANGQRGKCRTRINIDGDLRSLVYGRPVSIHVDPIEKKPLYHFLPGVEAFSLATAGCLLRCKFCQNWEISQASPEDLQVPFTPPAKIVNAAHAGKAPVIAFTYNEPTVFMEYLADISRDAKKQGIRSVLISCGFMNEAPLAEMCKMLDAIKIDRAFVHNLRSGSGSVSMLRAMLELARNMKLSTIVEGVEDKSQFELARMLGADEVQGFLFGRPGPNPAALLERCLLQGR